MNNLSFWLDVVKITIGIVIAVIGWIVGYKLASRSTREQKRRDIAVDHLITAYRVLTNDMLENILSDIQLFGSPTQVDMAKRLAEEVAAGGEFQLDPLINSLRNDLRKEINLEPVSGNVKWLRFNRE